MPIGAVITADIVNSTLFENREEQVTAELYKILKPYKYEFYRGDSFQVYIKEPEMALTVLVQLRATARRFSYMQDIRAGIGIGDVNPPIRKLSTANTKAFVLSGRAFDALARSESRLLIECSNPIINHAFKVISRFVDYLLKGLTEKQADVLLQMIDHETQIGAARNLGKSASTINKHVQASGWHDLTRIIEDYKYFVSTL